MNIKPSQTPGITLADQPTEEDLRGLRARGFVGVVNLRNDGEPDQPIGPATEGNFVRGLGMDYLHYGVGSAPLTEEGVTSVSDFLTRHAGHDVLVHCRKGSRAAALVLIREAQARGWAPDEAVTQGRAIGLDVDGGLRALVENYLRDHPTA
jgi:uncharacterized protein (TIGR01244 family)